MATPLRVSVGDPPLRRAPFRGEHTDAVLAELCGYTTERIDELTEAGVFGAPTTGAGAASAVTALGDPSA